MSWRAIVESSPGRIRALRDLVRELRRNTWLIAIVLMVLASLAAISSMGSERDSQDVAVLGTAAIAGLLVMLVSGLVMRTRLEKERSQFREGELRQSERRLEALLRNCSDMILVVAPDATVMYYAGSASLVLSEDPVRAAATNLTDCVDPDDVPRLLELCQTLDTAGAELQMRYADGSVHMCELSAAGLIDDSAWWGAVLNIRDISERRKLELERAKTAKLQERVAVERERHELEARLLHAHRLESIGALAGGVAHDFNNLLAVITNYVGFVREDLPEDSEVREDVEQIGHAAERGMRLTKQLLAFRKRKSGEIQLLDVGEVIEGMQAMLDRPLGSHIQLGYEPAEGVWRVHADPSDIEQIVLNLVVNARDALADGGEITISAGNVELTGEPADGAAVVAPGRYVKISVADDGCGIPPDVLEHVWESLFTTKPADKGTGLGLPTVRGIARKARGEATISSTVGSGTRVDVFLPVAADEPLGKPGHP